MNQTEYMENIKQIIDNEIVDNDELDNIEVSHVLLQTSLKLANVVVTNLWGGDNDIQKSLDTAVYLTSILESIKVLIESEIDDERQELINQWTQMVENTEN